MSTSASPQEPASSPPKPSETYTASCHCTRFKFNFTLSPPLSDPSCEVIDCNCSICTRNGYLLVMIPEVTFEQGTEEEFRTYTFATHKFTHYFCPSCGSSCYVKSPESGVTAVNVRMVKDVDFKSLTLKPLDGKSF